MKDSVIIGSGNSRYLKSVADFKTLYPTYDDFAAALVAGTLPIDLNGINAAGFQQVGDVLGKNTLLKDATAELYNMDSNAVPDDVFSYLSKSYVRKNLVQYTAETNDDIVFDLKNVDWSKRVFIEIVPTMNGKTNNTHRYMVNAKTDTLGSVDVQEYAYLTSTSWTSGRLMINEDTNELGKDSPIILELKSANIKGTGIGGLVLRYCTTYDKFVCFYARSNNSLITKLLFSKDGTNTFIGDRFTLFELG